MSKAIAKLASKKQPLSSTAAVAMAKAVKLLKAGNRIAAINTVVGKGRPDMGSYSYRTRANTWRNVSTRSIRKHMMNNKELNSSNIATVTAYTTGKVQRLFELVTQLNDQAVNNKNYSNVLRGHAGVARSVQVVDRRTGIVEYTALNAYQAASYLNMTRSQVYHALTKRTDGYLPTTGKYAVRYKV